MKILTYHRCYTPEGIDPACRLASSIQARTLAAIEPVEDISVAHYRDVSDGQTIHRRGLQMMLAELGRGGDAEVVVWSLDRLGAPKCLVDVLKSIAKLGAPIRIVEDNRIILPEETFIIHGNPDARGPQGILSQKGSR